MLLTVPVRTVLLAAALAAAALTAPARAGDSALGYCLRAAPPRAEWDDVGWAAVWRCVDRLEDEWRLAAARALMQQDAERRAPEQPPRPPARLRLL